MLKFTLTKYRTVKINTIKIFNDKDVDEICVLDISFNSEIDYVTLKDLASEAKINFFPLW